MAEAIAREVRHIGVGKFDDDFAFKAKAGGGRAIEIAASGFDDAGLVRRQRGGRSFKFQVEPLGHEIFNKKGALCDGVLFGVGVQPKPPRSCHRGFGERQRERAATKTLVVENETRVFDAVWAADDERRRQAGCFS